MMKLKFKPALSLLAFILMLQVAQPFNYSKLKNVVFERPYQERKNITLVARPSDTSRIQQNIQDYRQKEVWDMINTMDSFKTNRVYTQSTNGRPTATSFHYLIVPAWWDDQDTTDSSLLMNNNKLENVMNKVVEYYDEMSWGAMKMTYEVLPQTSIMATKKIFQAKWHVEKHVKDEGYVEEVDYDGIIFVFWKSSSALNWAGGAGMMNNNFIWVSYSSYTWKVIRHEVGHNFGHDHHSRNHYVYRETRPGLVNPYKSDGLDMMSGGNALDISDLHVSSKWFFNWVEDSSIIHMQAEGATTECPTCLDSGTFDIKPFDKRDRPLENEILGIHIPIATMYDPDYDSDYVFSYWLSYRSGVDDQARGLSVHLTFHELYDSKMGAYYDSLFHYAKGFSESKTEAVVRKGKCYHISPSSYLKDRVLLAAEAVQPVVCVDDFDVGSNVKVTVSFQQSSAKKMVQKSDLVKHNTQCGSNISKTLNPSKYNLIKVSRTGKNGKVTLKMCNPAATTKAYFSDAYPKSPLDFGSHEAYGSMARLQAEQGCKTTKMPSLQYTSDFDFTYILIPPTSAASSTSIELSCWTSTCTTNQYKSNGKCLRCPDHTPRSSAGSTKLSDCFGCGAGLSLPHPLATSCTISETFLPISSSNGWRVWAPDFHTINPDRWGMKKIEFYSNDECDGTPLNMNGEAIDSDNYGNGPDSAFNDNTDVWTGKKDSTGAFWIGMRFDNKRTVKCVKLKSTANSVREVRVQALLNNVWNNVWIQKDLDTTGRAEVFLSMIHPPTSAPTMQPTTQNQSHFPSNSPISTTSTESPSQQGCNESNKSVFLWFVKDNEARTKTCNWLSRQSESDKVRLCSKTNYFESFQPASEVCPVSCNTCGSGIPTKAPTKSPTQSPTTPPTPAPTASPTASPTRSPVQGTASPTNPPTPAPTASPTAAPTRSPVQGTASPTNPPTPAPTASPTSSPTRSPVQGTAAPTNPPTPAPTASPTSSPTRSPVQGTAAPTNPPTPAPTASPTSSPTRSPVQGTAAPTNPATQAPTASPIESTPTTMPIQCVENPYDIFVRSIVGDEITVKNCKWLSNKGRVVRESVCNENLSSDNLGSASEVCPITCNLCVSGPTASPTQAPQKENVECEDDNTKKFFFKYQRDENGEVVDVITRSCFWLRSRRPSVQIQFCGREVVSDIPSARDICKGTCASC